MQTSIIPGILMIVIGTAILYWVGKRRFMRRGVGGLQHFSSYDRALIISLIECVAKILAWC
ncbi:MAG: hypothetical protein QM802_02540 [Agriterribacter sp.]